MSTKTTGVIRHTFNLARVIMALKNAQTLCEALQKEKDVTGTAKHVLGRVAMRARGGIGEFSRMLSPASLEVMNKEMIDDEVCLQMMNIEDLLLALPKETRDTVENYVQALYNQYSSRKEALPAEVA